MARVPRRDQRKVTRARRLIPHFGEKPLDAIRSCDVEDFMAVMLGECSPAYANNCVRTMKALMNHAVKRQLITASPLTEDSLRGRTVPELELNDEERLAFTGAFDDENGFRENVANRRQDAHFLTTESFKVPRKFGFGTNPVPAERVTALSADGHSYAVSNADGSAGVFDLDGTPGAILTRLCSLSN